jgi:alkanesulfonate monooxygenase SsuD/methylene tetrahydromethanopterin reductase-like flavin-dependent oxidoreductase (luciferase family)
MGDDVQRGFGVAGALDHDIIRLVAAEVERLGYASFWTNDTLKGDGLSALRAAAESTGSVRLGVGVIPVDRVSPERIAERVDELQLPRERLLVGIGAGGRKQGSLDLVREACRVLREQGIATAVGALGPKMVQLAAEEADGVLLNWLTPGAAARSTEAIRADAGNRTPRAIAYVRVAFGDGALRRLESEALRYESFPQYAAHFDRMGVRAIDTCVEGPTAAAIQAGLSTFGAVVDETVVRAITGEESTGAYLALARAAAPPDR